MIDICVMKRPGNVSGHAQKVIEKTLQSKGKPHKWESMTSQ